MTHRVLIDFQVPGEALDKMNPQVQVSDPVIIEKEPEFVQILRKHFSKSGWESEFYNEASRIFNHMALQLPNDDLPSYVRNTKFVMSRKGPRAYLTVGYFLDSGIGRVRLRVGATSEAVLVDLGRRIANELIASFPKVSLNTMELYESRRDTALLSGKEMADEGYQPKFWAKENTPVWLPMVLASCFLVVGFGLQAWFHPPWDTAFFEGRFGQWYGRLIGPTGMAIVTTTSVWLATVSNRVDARRWIEWDLQSGGIN